MRKYVILVLIVLASGCMQTELFCPDCDDGNPCTFDYCNQTTVSCEHRPLAGEYDSCSGEVSCMQKSCVNGSCASERKADCCGNGACEPAESYMTCARDCKASCTDGVKNEGEGGVDCGGPCMPCTPVSLDSLQKIDGIRTEWVKLTVEYNDAVTKYNSNLQAAEFGDTAARVHDQTAILYSKANSLETPPEFIGLKTMLSKTLSLYMLSTESMANFTVTHDDRYRISANRILDDAIKQDRLFVEGYNAFVMSFNERQAKCGNGKKDANEDGIDCGKICGRTCSATINITKIVVIENSGYSTELTLKVTPAAIKYLPIQDVLDVKLSPQPFSNISDAEGNTYYLYKMSLERYQSKEFQIMQTIKINGGMEFVKSSSTASGGKFLSLPKSKTQDDICLTARNLSVPGNATASAENVFSWMKDNIVYELNTKEFGAEYCYINRRGACDEHSDLFVSMMGCLSIPARRVTGYINNGTDVNGHAWAEYYDNGWIYAEPSSKQNLQGFITDQEHIITCVGEKATDCSTTYTYSYTENKKPKINVTEKVFLS